MDYTKLLEYVLEFWLLWWLGELCGPHLCCLLTLIRLLYYNIFNMVYFMQATNAKMVRFIVYESDPVQPDHSSISANTQYLKVYFTYWLRSDIEPLEASPIPCYLQEFPPVSCLTPALFPLSTFSYTAHSTFSIWPQSPPSDLPINTKMTLSMVLAAVIPLLAAANFLIWAWY